jgi:hypothetical protein
VTTEKLVSSRILAMLRFILTQFFNPKSVAVCHFRAQARCSCASVRVLLLLVGFFLVHPAMDRLRAADFKLLSAAIQSSATSPTTSPRPRFTLTQTQLTPVSAGLPTVGQRFELQAQAGAVAFVQEAGLPKLRLQNLGADLELNWDDQPLLTGLILESSAAAAPGGWQAEAVEVTATGRRLVVRQSAQSSGTRFFRLRKP